MEKNPSADLLRRVALTPGETQTAFRERLEAISQIKTPLKMEEAQEALQQLYKEVSAFTLPFGETVEKIMRIQGLTKKWGNKEILDISSAVKLTKLSRGVFQTNMWKADCVVDMSLVISMAIGFKLSPVLTDRLLQSAGLAFRLDNPEHLAYMFLLEYCRDLNVVECNKILDSLGIRKTRQLGSHARGEDGVYEGYRKSDDIE